jgi:DNA-binding transcriptional LysR family regulator
LRRAEIDLAITYDLQLAADIDFVSLASLPPHVVVARNHELANADRVTIEQLASMPMVLLDLPLSREYFFSLFYSKKLEPSIAWTSPHPDVVRAMIANGFGYGIFNAAPRNESALDGKRLRRIRLAGDHHPMRLGLAFLPALKKTRLVTEFELHCRQSISSKKIPGMAEAGAAKRGRPRSS